MNKNIFCSLAVAIAGCLFSINVSAQNVGINTTGAAANASAILDLNTGNAGNRGFLAPQVSLISITDVATIPTPATGLIVYNTNGSITNGLGVGYYYWNGTDWLYLYNSGSTSAWQLAGNTGTTAGTNYIGTTDANGLMIKTYGTERAFFSGTSIGVTQLDILAGNTQAVNQPLVELQTSGGGDLMDINADNNSDVFIGYQAGWNNVNNGINSNVLVGYEAGYTNTTGGNITAIGWGALLSNTMSDNTAVGNACLYLNTTGTENTAMGNFTLVYNIGGSYDVAFGSDALYENTSGSYNAALGYASLFYNNGSSNSALGNYSLYNNGSGGDNAAVGYGALESNSSGSNNTAIGYQADVALNNLTNATAIGNGAIAGQSNALVLGNALAQTGIQTNYPQRAFEIGGAGNTARIDGLGSGGTIFNQTSATNVGNIIYANKANGDLWSITAPTVASVLVSSAAGVLSWQSGAVPTGSGTTNYYARWTPSGTQLGVGFTEDNGTSVSMSSPASAPVNTNMLTVTGNTTSINSVVGNSVATSGAGVKGTEVNPASSGGYGVEGLISGNGGGLQYALYGASTVTIGNGFGVYGAATGSGASINYGGYFAASGATSNYNIALLSQGNTGIATVSYPSTASNINFVLPTANAAVAGAALVSTGLNATLTWTSAAAASGSGTLNYVAKWTPNGSTLGNSLIYDNGTNVGINQTSPVCPLDVNGYLHVSGNTAPTVTSQGAYLNWNALTGGTGETDFINNEGGGSGGFAFMNTPSSGTPKTTVVFITGAGLTGIGTTAPNARETVIGAGTGYVDIGDAGCGSNYAGIACNGQAFSSCSNYNMLSSPTDPQLYFNRPSGNTIRFRENNADEMTIASGGYVGINTTAPIAPLEISNTGDMAYLDLNTTAANKRTRINFSQNGTEYMEIGTDYAVNNTADFYIYNRNSGSTAAYFYPGNDVWLSARSTSSDFYITSTGNIGMGTTAPAYQLQLSTNSAAKPGTNTWTIASDARLKQDIKPYSDGLDKLLKINPVTFHYNKLSGNDTKPQYVGVLAQEIKEIAPYMVGTFKKDSVEYLSLDNGAMTYMLINGVKEQQKMITDQQRSIDELRAENEALKKQVSELANSVEQVLNKK